MAEDKRPERHPNGTPRTIHHWEEGEPVYHDEVEDLTDEERAQLGYSAGKEEAAAPRKKVKLT